MKLQKIQVLIGAFIIFWIIVIGWGMLKTGLKLTKDKSTDISQTETKEALPKKSDEITPQPATPKSEPQAVLVRALKVKAIDFNDVLPVMGTVKGKTEIELKFEINGVIKNINFREGDKIKKGDCIACLDPKDAELKLAYAKNKFNAAQAGYNSVQKKLEVHQRLYEAGAIIKTKLEEVQLECESAKYQVETAKSEMELAENELNKTCIYATKDGVMGKREAEEGEFATPQDKIGSLLEVSEVFVEVGVVERDIEKVKLGQKVKVFVDAYPTVNFEGTVKYIFPVIEGKSRTLTVKINVPNAEGLLLPGMFSRAEISIISLEDALIVPITCLTYTKTGVVVVPAIPGESIEKIDEETQIGFTKLRTVTLGYKTSDYAEVKEGLHAGDLVVLEVQGEGKLEDNTKVKIVGIEELSF